MSKTSKKLSQIMPNPENADNSFQTIIDEAYEVLGNPIILYNFDLKVLAFAAGGTLFWDSIMHDGMIKKEVIDLYFKEGAFSQIADQNRQVMFLKNEHLKHHSIYAKIYDKDALPIAFISIVEYNKTFNDHDLVTAKELCNTFSSILCKIPYYQNYSQSLLDTYINKLISNEITDIFYNSGYVDIIYKNLEENLYLAVADISQNPDAYGALSYYRDIFKQAQPAYKYSIYSKYIVIILGIRGTKLYPRRGFGNLIRIFEEYDIKVGVSSRFENLFELSRYYNEAVEALNSGLESENGKRIFVYGK